MKIKSMIADVSDFLKSRVFLILWISLVLYLFYDTFNFYKYGPQFYYLRRILGLGLCISRGTATVLNLSCALVLLPFCKKINKVLNRILSKLCPELFFFWLESAKSFHMNIAVTLLLFGVIHSFSHFANLWNFSRNYDQNRLEINFANYKNENPLRLLMSVAGMTGVLMLLIILGMGLTSARFVRRRTYNAFWYTHQLYLPFMVMLLIHPLGGVLKEEVLEENDPSLNPSRIKNLTNSVIYTRLFDAPKFTPIKSKHWMWMSAPLCCFLIDLLWRIFSRNLASIDIAKIRVMPGQTICLTLSTPYELFAVRIGQYVLLQCQQISLLEWHPFTVVKVPTSSQREFVVWIRVKGDWTETLEKLLFQKLHTQIRMLVDGPFSSPMEGVMRSDVAICVAAGVGITPFVAVLHNMYLYPRNVLPGRIHLIWIVRYEKEITWLAELASKTINQLRYANRPDRLHLEFYVTNSEMKDIAQVQNSITHMVVIDGKTGFTNVINKNERVLTDDEKTSLLTPNVKKKVKRDVEISLRTDDIVRQYPVLGCRIRRGRPYWDKTFGYWVHLYPGDHLNLFCCGPKKLVKLLRNKCKIYTKNTKTKFAFIHEGFS